MTKYEIWLVADDGTIEHVGQEDGGSAEQALRNRGKKHAEKTSTPMSGRYMIVPSGNVTILSPKPRPVEPSYEMEELDLATAFGAATVAPTETAVEA